MATNGRNRSQAVFGRLRLRGVEPSGVHGVQPHHAEGRKQRRGPEQEIPILWRSLQDEALDELVRPRVDELRDTCLTTNADRDFGESRRNAGEALPVQRRKRPGDMFNDCLDDARGRLGDPDGVGGELRGNLSRDVSS